MTGRRLRYIPQLVRHVNFMIVMQCLDSSHAKPAGAARGVCCEPFEYSSVLLRFFFLVLRRGSNPWAVLAARGATGAVHLAVFVAATQLALNHSALHRVQERGQHRHLRTGLGAFSAAHAGSGNHHTHRAEASLCTDCPEGEKRGHPGPFAQHRPTDGVAETRGSCPTPLPLGNAHARSRNHVGCGAEAGVPSQLGSAVHPSLPQW